MSDEEVKDLLWDEGIGFVFKKKGTLFYKSWERKSVLKLQWNSKTVK